MKKYLLYSIFIAISWSPFSYGYSKVDLSPHEALKRLMKGNERFTHDALEHPNRTVIRRAASRSSQFPYAVIVGCSDSRVSPEIIFDEGVGDLFVVRVAGNVVGSLEEESIEYAVTALKSVLILVVGHENCGAVRAVVEGKAEGLSDLSLMIEPAVKEAEGDDSKSLVKSAIKKNALRMKKLLLESELIGQLAEEKKIAVEAAYYHLQTGIVEIL